MNIFARLALLALAFAVLVYCTVVQAFHNQASFAVNVQNRAGTGDPYEFDAIVINRGDALNQDTWHFFAPSDGLYLVFLTVGYPGQGQNTDFRLVQNGTVMASIRRTPVSGGISQTMGLDIISWFYTDSYLSISSSGSMLASTPSGLWTSWGIFSLSRDLGAQVGFGVASKAAYTAGIVQFDKVWTNRGNAWNTSSSSFIAPVSGVYFFSMSAGVQKGNSVLLYLNVEGTNILALNSYGSSNSDVDSHGRAVLVYLTAEEHVQLRSNTSGFSDDSYLTTFSGFLYNNSRTESLAWSAYANRGYVGSSNPFPFDFVSVNVGGSLYNHRVHCLFSGYYYIHVSGYMNVPAVLRVMVGNQVAAELVRGSGTGAPFILSRSLIANCNAGETIWCASEGNIWGGGTLPTSFMGFYLF